MRGALMFLLVLSTALNVFFVWAFAKVGNPEVLVSGAHEQQVTQEKPSAQQVPVQTAADKPAAAAAEQKATPQPIETKPTPNPKAATPSLQRSTP